MHLHMRTLQGGLPWHKIVVLRLACMGALTSAPASDKPAVSLQTKNWHCLPPWQQEVKARARLYYSYHRSAVLLLLRHTNSFPNDLHYSSCSSMWLTNVRRVQGKRCATAQTLCPFWPWQALCCSCNQLALASTNTARIAAGDSRYETEPLFCRLSCERHLCAVA